MKKNNTKTVLISGASSGIGKATAKLLKKAGYNVYGAARRVEKMQDLQEMGITTLFMDVTQDESVVNVVNMIIERDGHIDILINNAGFGIYGTVEDVPMSEARRQLDVNLFGVARLTQLVLPHMRKQKSGTIINMSSVAGKMSMPLGTWYHASKHALEALSDSLRLEVERYGIDVIIIEPGIIDTAWWSIAEQNLENDSRNTAYTELVEKVKEYLENPGEASDPKEIALIIKKAIKAKKPKTRYTGGKNAKLIIAAKKNLPDRVFDDMMKKKLGMESEEKKEADFL